jgi:hypothetical protein
VNYFEFLVQPYNLVWLAMIVAGVIALIWRARLRVRGSAGVPEAPPPPVRTSIPVLLLTAGLVGLTINGALHDLRLDPIGPRQPLVTTISLAAGWLLAWGGPRLRRRAFPPVTAVKFNEPGLEGAVAVVLSRGIGSGDEPGRARHHGDDGVSHIVRVAPAGEHTLRFGMKVTLGPFDDTKRAYPATPV